MRRNILSALVAALFVPACLTAQKASYTFPKNMTPGCLDSKNNEVVIFNVTGVPKVGASFSVTTRTSAWWGSMFKLYSRQVWILTGYSKTRFANLNLPFDPRVICRRSCGLLRTSLIVVTPVPLGNPTQTSTIKFHVPNDSRLVGLSFYQQAMEVFIEYGGRRLASNGCPDFSRGGHEGSWCAQD